MQTRYQIIYSKNSYPIATWSKSRAHAVSFADRLLSAGYTVTVAEHSRIGSRIIYGGVDRIQEGE